ncbi:MAG: phospholipase D-like domain-containing protein [Myxococcales bacterium]
MREQGELQKAGAPGSSAVERYCLSPHRMRPGHRVEVLVDGAAAYPAMLAAILSARREVLLETYIFESDAAGRRFHHALCDRALAGVEVRVVVDGAGSWGFSSADRRALLDCGVHLATFHPVGPWRARWGWSVRDHRKILVVDEEVAFVGGMNIGDDYAPVDWGGKGWHDVHARVEGPSVEDVRRYFFDSWTYAVPDREPAMRALPPAHRAHPPHPVPPPRDGEGARVQALVVGRFRDRRLIERHLQHAVALASHRVLVQSAYFIPNRRWRRTLRRTARRGVDVRLLVPRYNDVPGIRDASRFTWGTLLRAGVRIFEYQPTMLHAKTLTVDSCWCSIGSYNLDQRSLQYNWEVALSVVDRDACRVLEEGFERDLQKSEEISLAGWSKRGVWQRIREQFFYFFRLWL